eukprot:CAMPEP_0185269294 /NCGR_PEP_ID=MMETSP1359-20130426/39379_1 /TAXON_ID=552665 /ORGANISM="Bigelowiella longifila, Strain CCMP242" /LENGTH=146 /DNA_ID=CAMNT_0027860395 /DNA_START=24 /DNA_END=464 /DNA_ORIENTATION=-
MAVFNVNVFGVLRVTQAFLPLLSQYHGRIVNIGSLAGIWAGGLDPGYAGSKYALEGITDTMRVKAREMHVSVSIVEPGFVRSNMCKASFCRLGPEVTTEAIEHALLNPNPLSRYPCAEVFGVPAWLVAWGGHHLPDAVKDLVVEYL